MYQTGLELTKAAYKRAMQDTSNRRKDEAGRMLDYYNNGQLEHILDDMRIRYPKPEKIYRKNFDYYRRNFTSWS